MNNTPATPPDDIDDLLNPRVPPAGADALRPSLLLQTTAVLRRRRRLKRAALVAAMAACYVAGMLTMRFGLAPARQAGTDRLTTRPSGPNETKLPDENRQPQGGVKDKKPKATPQVADSALAWEWQALDHPERRAELYRRAGDRYLRDNDVSSALRCYRGALAAGPEKDWNISVNDNWLLMAAKQERQKENRNAQNGG